MVKEYKKGDKVIIEIDEVDAKNLNNSFLVHLVRKQILGKLEDSQPAQEKIKMTVEEKKEFDEMRHDFLDHPRSVYEIMLEVFEMGTYQLLQAKCSGSFDEQFKLLKCIANPRLIEAVEPKAYAVDINGSRLYKWGNKWSFAKGIYVRLTLDEVKEAEKQLGICGLQAKWHEAAKEDGE